MHTNYVNCSADHYRDPGRRFYFVGDGCECLSAHSSESEALSVATKLNRENDTTEYAVYAVDIDERDEDDQFMFPAERAAAQNAGYC